VLFHLPLVQDLCCWYDKIQYIFTVCFSLIFCFYKGSTTSLLLVYSTSVKRFRFPRLSITIHILVRSLYSDSFQSIFYPSMGCSPWLLVLPLHRGTGVHQQLCQSIHLRCHVPRVSERCQAYDRKNQGNTAVSNLLRHLERNGAGLSIRQVMYLDFRSWFSLPFTVVFLSSNPCSAGLNSDQLEDILGPSRSRLENYLERAETAAASMPDPVNTLQYLATAFIHWLIHSFIHLFIHSFIHSFITWILL